VKFDISETQVMTIIPEPECGIAEAVGDYEIIKNIPGELKEIRLISDQIKEMDTGYFQLLLSVKSMAAEKNIAFTVSGKSRALDEVCRLYGQELKYHQTDDPSAPMPLR
jgi:hypothetical protein